MISSWDLTFLSKLQWRTLTFFSTTCLIFLMRLKEKELRNSYFDKMVHIHILPLVFVIGFRIGRGGIVAWPPRKPGLYSINFVMWGFMESELLVTVLNIEEYFLNRIVVSANKVSGTFSFKANRKMLI